MAELPLVPRTCETTQEREWRSVTSSFGGAQPCSNIPSKQEEHHSELSTQAVSPVPALCQTPESVQCLSSLLVWGLPGLGDGIHIALLLLRGSAK